MPPRGRRGAARDRRGLHAARDEHARRGARAARHDRGDRRGARRRAAGAEDRPVALAPAPPPQEEAARARPRSRRPRTAEVTAERASPASAPTNGDAPAEPPPQAPPAAASLRARRDAGQAASDTVRRRVKRSDRTCGATLGNVARAARDRLRRRSDHRDLAVRAAGAAGAARGRRLGAQAAADHRGARRRASSCSRCLRPGSSTSSACPTTCSATSRSRCSSSSRRRCSSRRSGSWLERPFARLTRYRAGGGGFLLGASLGLVFVPCAGPVLAAIATVAATNEVTFRAVAFTLAYALGAAVPMLLVAYGGQAMATRIRVDGAAAAVRISGLVIGAVALAIAFNVDTRFQTALPGYTQALQKHVEETGAARTRAREGDRGEGTRRRPSRTPGAALPFYGKAPPLEPGRRMVQHDAAHARPAPRQGRAGRLLDVLVHQLPAHAPASRGLVPRLPPRRARDHRRPHTRVRVRARRLERRRGRQAPRDPATRSSRTTTYGTWNNYSNSYWPAEYLIDRAGHVRSYHFGEGDYGTSEQNIRTLLGLGPDARSPSRTRRRPARSRPSRTSATSGSTRRRYVGTPVTGGQAEDLCRRREAVPREQPRPTPAPGGSRASGSWRERTQG